MRVSRRTAAGESVTKDNRAEEGEKGGHTLLKEGILCLLDTSNFLPTGAT